MTYFIKRFRDPPTENARSAVPRACEDGRQGQAGFAARPRDYVGARVSEIGCSGGRWGRSRSGLLATGQQGCREEDCEGVHGGSIMVCVSYLGRPSVSTGVIPLPCVQSF